MRYGVRTRSIMSAFIAVMVCITLTGGCAGPGRPGRPAAVPEIYPGISVGYLAQEALPDSLFLLPMPPAPGTAAMALDEEASRRGLALRNTPRFALAARDANLTFPEAAGAFSCALNAPITEQETPYLITLLRRSLTDAGFSTFRAKDRYRRARPFMVNGAPSCTPDKEEGLSKNGSYPSGHAAAGWAWALILTEIAPDRTDAILARGRAFGESRVVCNVHWLSDVVEGRLMGAGTLARLHADEAFRADLKAAKAELAAVRAKGLKPLRDCDRESKAMAAEATAAGPTAK